MRLTSAMCAVTLMLLLVSPFAYGQSTPATLSASAGGSTGMAPLTQVAHASRVRMTAGRAKHEIFRLMRHGRLESYYDEGAVKGPVFKSCFSASRLLVFCAFEVRIRATHACGVGSSRYYRSGGSLYTATRFATRYTPFFPCLRSEFQAALRASERQ